MTETRNESQLKLKAVLYPRGFSDVVSQALDRMFAASTDYFEKALLTKAEYENGASGYLMVISGVPSGATTEFADMVDEVIASVGHKDIRLDVTFVAKDDPALARLMRVGRNLSPK